MNTLVAFSTITALAVAVPTLSVKQLEESLFQDKQIAKQNHESFDSELKTPSMGFVSESNENQERTFLKKKLLQKKLKKFRDNEEEAKSESQEKNKSKSDGPQCIKHNSEDWGVNDFDITLRVVINAIESLQAVINKQEEKKKISESKTDKSRNAENESEEELDETVEKAKEALEQIRSDIVNLEELRLRTASFNSPSSAHESLKEEERLAQWKETVEKIHRNVEIARNLEDNFKSEGQFSGPMEATSDITDQKFKMQFASNDDKMKSEKQEKSSWHHDEFKTDMKAAVEGAKEPAPMKNDEHMHIKSCGVHDKPFVGPHKHRKHSAPTQNSTGTKEKKSNQLNAPKNNSDENKSDSSSQESEKLEEQMPNNKENPLKGEEKNKTGSPLHKENKPMEAMGHNKTKSDSDIDMSENNQKDLKKVESDSHVAASNQIAHVLKPETKTENGMQNSNKTMVAKPENNQPSESQMNSRSQQMGQSRFSQQDSIRSNDQLHESQHWHEEHGPHFNSFMKASDEHNQRFHPMKQNIHHESPMGSNGMMPGRSAEMANVMWDNMSDMRSAPIHNRWQELHRSRGAYGPGLGYGTLQPPSGSASSGSATTSGGSGSGSVGVFSNAKIGDCGIPFLLSCSPSVVTGTLSETNSYSKPAYRAESKHFSFHDKRDTKKVNRFPSQKERQGH